MRDQAVPIIREEDFEAFRRLLKGDIPDTFDGWKQSTRELVEVIENEGKTAIAVEVNPDEFAAWMADHGHQSSPNTLSLFAAFERWGENT